MKVTIQRATLLKPLQFVSGVVERKQTMPILSNLLLKASAETLSLTSSDTEIELMAICFPEKISQPGETTVSARKLLDICRALPEEAVVHLEGEGSQIVLRSGRSRFLLATLPASDFPAVEHPVFTSQFSISQGRLKNLLANVHFAMGQQDVRHYLNGALIDISPNLLKCVATDGHRLAFSQIETKLTDVTPAKVILPRKTVMELLRLPESGELLVSIGENHFRVQSADFTLTSRLVAAQYPDYERLIPRQIEYTAIACRESLRQALTRASILSGEKFRGVCLTLGNESLRIVANNPEQELAEETIPLDYQGENTEIGFNVAYLLDVLSTVLSDKIRCSFSDPQSGVLIEPVWLNPVENTEQSAQLAVPEEKSSLYVVMPMRL